MTEWRQQYGIIGQEGRTALMVWLIWYSQCLKSITLIGDITTEKCRSSIRSEMQGAKADVVLCDGAPNIGSSYDRDAYQQNEIALHALKCATEHLKRDGSYVTKIYRSSDYSSYLWVVKQFFIYAAEARGVVPAICAPRLVRPR